METNRIWCLMTLDVYLTGTVDTRLHNVYEGTVE